jgi:hypothetical protein
MPAFTFPETKFVSTNTPFQQVRHIVSEIFEVCVDLWKGQHYKAMVECYDVIHSVETLIRILARRFEWTLAIEWQAESLKKVVEDKNRRRGYYVEKSS